MLSKIEWAEMAVAGIILPKERESARQELLDHMDDHMEALLSAGVPEQEAKRQAVAAMGDPKDTAKLLRKAHQPILTRILQAARVMTICLTVVAVLSVFTAWVKKDDILPRWLEGKPYPEEQAWFFEHPVDDSILYRRVCQPEASVTIGDYVLRVDKAAVVQYTDRWEVFLLAEMDGKWPWQDAPLLPDNCIPLADGQPVDFRYTAFWGHRNGGSYYSRFYVELPGEPHELTLELPCEGQTYTLRIDLRGGDVYEKAH